MVDRRQLTGRVDLVEVDGRPLDATAARALLASRPPHPALAAHRGLPDDTRLWAALQRVGGGTWGGCVYDVDRIIEILDAGLETLNRKSIDL